jgi:signal transduction histidine kinase
VVHYADFHFRPVFDVFGSVIAVIGTAVDVTIRHEIDSQKDDFIALAAHELRTPLTSVKGFARISLSAAERTGDERLVKSLKIIDGQCDRLARRIAELLEVSQIATRRDALPLQVEPVNYNALVSEVTDGLKMVAPDFTFVLDLPEGPIWVDVDSDRMEEVITNLVGNAVKFSGESRRIEITVRFDGREVVTSVRDFGLGVATCDQERIFERYYRAASVSSRYGGLGVGLYVARTIIARHGGRMWCESNVGRGSTFYFTFPVISA